jgi:hypothetical protein
MLPDRLFRDVTRPSQLGLDAQLLRKPIQLLRIRMVGGITTSGMDRPPSLTGQGCHLD